MKREHWEEMGEFIFATRVLRYENWILRNIHITLTNILNLCYSDHVQNTYPANTLRKFNVVLWLYFGKLILIT